MELRIAVRVTEEQYKYVQKMGHSYLRKLIDADMKRSIKRTRRAAIEQILDEAGY
jgi:hypothetical protein